MLYHYTWRDGNEDYQNDGLQYRLKLNRRYAFNQTGTAYGRDDPDVWARDLTPTLGITGVTSGLLSARPASGTSGAVWHATDNGKFYVWTGTVWSDNLTGWPTQQNKFKTTKIAGGLLPTGPQGQASSGYAFARSLTSVPFTADHEGGMLPVPQDQYKSRLGRTEYAGNVGFTIEYWVYLDRTVPTKSPGHTAALNKYLLPGPENTFNLRLIGSGATSGTAAAEGTEVGFCIGDYLFKMPNSILSESGEAVFLDGTVSVPSGNPNLEYRKPLVAQPKVGTWFHVAVTHYPWMSSGNHFQNTVGGLGGDSLYPSMAQRTLVHINGVLTTPISVASFTTHVPFEQLYRDDAARSLAYPAGTLKDDPFESFGGDYRSLYIPDTSNATEGFGEAIIREINVWDYARYGYDNFTPYWEQDDSSMLPAGATPSVRSALLPFEDVDTGYSHDFVFPYTAEDTTVGGWCPNDLPPLDIQFVTVPEGPDLTYRVTRTTWRWSYNAGSNTWSHDAQVANGGSFGGVFLGPEIRTGEWINDYFSNPLTWRENGDYVPGYPYDHRHYAYEIIVEQFKGGVYQGTRTQTIHFLSQSKTVFPPLQSCIGWAVGAPTNGSTISAGVSPLWTPPAPTWQSVIGTVFNVPNNNIYLYSTIGSANTDGTYSNTVDLSDIAGTFPEEEGVVYNVKAESFVWNTQYNRAHDVPSDAEWFLGPMEGFASRDQGSEVEFLYPNYDATVAYSATEIADVINSARWREKGYLLDSSITHAPYCVIFTIYKEYVGSHIEEAAFALNMLPPTGTIFEMYHPPFDPSAPGYGEDGEFYRRIGDFENGFPLTFDDN